LNGVMRVALAFLLLLATPLRGEGGEICRFRALDAENPFRRWLASQEVTCVAAGAPIAFPPGLWNVFARAEGAVSAASLLIAGDGGPVPVAPELGPGAAVTPLLPEGHSGVVYVPRRGSAVPVDKARVTVPADEPLWLFVLEKSNPVAVIPIAPLPPGTERSVDARSGGPASIVGWLQVPEPDRTALARASGVSAPAVRAGARDADPLPPPALLHGAFYRVRDAAPGNAELRVEGRGWLPERRVVKVQPGLTIAAAPLVVRAAGTLTVHWNADRDLHELERSVGACDDDEAAPPRLTIVISKCARTGPRREEECAPVREEKADALNGSATFDDVVPGLYRAEMRFGKLPPAGAQASVGPLAVADLRVIASYFTGYGSVTRGGEPLGEDVRLRFPGGIGFAPEETEEYRAVFNSFIEAEAKIEIAACDGAPRAVVLTDRPIRPFGRFNIDIPANELTLHVNDTFTREALPGATVKLEAMSVLRPPRVVFTTTETADEQGNVVWTGVPIRELRLTVSHTGYEKRVLEPFTMPGSGTHAIDAQLVPLRGTRGKIVSDRPFDSAMVVWFSPTGSETERADLAADGTFVHLNWHTAEETLAVVSASHPLWVLRAPASERRQSLTLRFPDAPAAAFDVWRAEAVPPGETRYVGVVIGGVRVPQPVLAQHQTLRRDPPLMRGPGPHPFHDLLATGPIDVLLGPIFEEVASRARALDLFALPQFADVPKQRLDPGTTDVVFPSH
jgi:hypothetical protein